MIDEWKPIKTSGKHLANDQIAIRKSTSNRHKVYFSTALMKYIHRENALFCNVYKKNFRLLFQFTNKRETGISRQLHRHSCALPEDVFASFNISRGTTSLLVQADRSGIVTVDLEQLTRR